MAKRGKRQVPKGPARRPTAAVVNTRKSGSASSAGPTKSSARSTVSGPARRTGATRDAVAGKLEATEIVAEAFPFNAAKPSEYGKAASKPQPGQYVEALDPKVGASTLSEPNASPKTGKAAVPGFNPGSDPLMRVRVDSSGRALTTNQGVTVGDNQNSLKAGLRGPSLLEDFILREKITHFDHERIPERIVHARGSGAHGYFECTAPLTELKIGRAHV